MTILIADKSFEVRERIKDLINDIYDDVKLFETDSSIEAMKIVDSIKTDLVITDIDLNNGSGLGLLTMLNALNPQTLKIVFTNHTSYNLEEISRRIGADYFLSKTHDIIRIKKILTDNNEQQTKFEHK